MASNTHKREEAAYTKKCSSIQSFTQMKYTYFGFFEFFLQGKSQVYQKQNEQVQIHEIRLFHEIPIKASTCIKPNSFLVFHMYLPLETILIKTSWFITMWNLVSSTKSNSHCYTSNQIQITISLPYTFIHSALKKNKNSQREGGRKRSREQISLTKILTKLTTNICG